MSINSENHYRQQTTRIQKQFLLSVFVFIDSLVISALQDSGGYAISRSNNLELHLGCHTCRLRYFTLVCLWWGQTIGCSVGRCTVTWLPNFLGRVDLLSYGAPQACVSRARRAPLRTELIYTFRVGLNFGESILNIQVATTALLQVSLYFSDAQITKFSYPQCTVHRCALESFAKNVCGEPRRSKRQNKFMPHCSHFVSGDLKSFVYAQLAS